jgi:hypothetical protein
VEQVEIKKKYRGQGWGLLAVNEVLKHKQDEWRICTVYLGDLDNKLSPYVCGLRSETVFTPSSRHCFHLCLSPHISSSGWGSSPYRATSNKCI